MFRSKTVTCDKAIDSVFKDVFDLIDFFKLLLRTDNDLLVSEMKYKLGVTSFVSEIRRVENSDFYKVGARNSA